MREFWKLVATLQGRTDDVEPLVEALCAAGPGKVLGFANTLARRLHDLDRFDLFGQPVREPDQAPDSPTIPLSDDGFLYARCAVVVAGKERFDEVLADPDAFAGTWSTDGEDLLYAASTAWERLTGQDWDHEEPVSYETGSNPKGGWPPEPFVLDPDTPTIRFETSSWVQSAHVPGPGQRYYRTFGETLLTAAEQVQTEADLLLRQHGGWPAPTAYAIVWCVPTNFWDLSIAHHGGPLPWPPDLGPVPDDHPHYQAPKIVASKDDTLRWSRQEAVTGCRAVIAHVALELLRRMGASDHGAAVPLGNWLEAGAHLVPALPRTDV